MGYRIVSELVTLHALRRDSQIIDDVIITSKHVCSGSVIKWGFGDKVSWIVEA